MKNLPFSLCVILVCTLHFSCSRSPYHTSNKLYKKQAKAFASELRAQPSQSLYIGATPPTWAGTTNFNLRKPNYVIIHHTAQNSCEQTLKTFTLVRTQVSAHYVICKDGTVHHMLNDYLRAWHGGAARWGSLTDINSASIGIELDNNGYEPFTSPQINSLLVVLDTLRKKHNIPAANIIGHGDIAPTRKVDPNLFFPWQQLAARGFGTWYSDTSLVQVPESFSSSQALRIIGYDVRDSIAAQRAFKRHFLADSTLPFTEGHKKILYSVMQNSLQ